MPETWTILDDLPKCDLCHNMAYADAKIPYGPWGYFCKHHFLLLECNLGLGSGQELLTKEQAIRRGLIKK